MTINLNLNLLDVLTVSYDEINFGRGAIIRPTSTADDRKDVNHDFYMVLGDWNRWAVKNLRTGRVEEDSFTAFRDYMDADGYLDIELYTI